VENVICEDSRKINQRIISIHNGVPKKKRVGVASPIRHHLTKRIQFPNDEGIEGPRNVGLLAHQAAGLRIFH